MNIKIKHYLVGMLCMLPLFISAQVLQIDQSPLIWLRADIYGNTDSIWQDCRNNGYKANSNTSQLLPAKTLFNFNQAFDFDGLQSAYQLNFTPGSEEYFKIYSIYQAEDSTIEMGIWHMQLDSASDLQLSTHSIKSLRFDIQYDSITNTIPIINTSIQTWKQQPVDSNLAGFTIAGTDSVNFKGKFAEFMIFRNPLSNFDNVKVHTYLAMKYGVCLWGMNYQFSDTTIVWDAESNKNFDHEIASIGRDDSLGIYQKQSAGNGGLAELTISAGNLEISNDSNHTYISNYNALIWGHNGKDYSIDPDTNNLQTVNFLTDCKWLLQVSGDSANQLSTNLRFNIQQLGAVQDLKLVINPYCLTEYLTDSCIIVAPDSMDLMGNYYFSNIQWDADGSGMDMFAFSGVPNQNTFRVSDPNSHDPTEQDSEFTCQIFPNPTEGYFTVAYASDLEADVVIVLSDAAGKTISTQKVPLTNGFEVEQFLDTPGIYFISINNSVKAQTYKIIVK